MIEIGTNDYDLIYIDWVRGTADLRDNSRVLEEVLEWVNDQKVPNATGIIEQNVLLGQSMGGVIGRYTLARMENAQSTNPSAPGHDVRLFVAHDSPMQGANLPLAFQHFSVHMKEEYVSTPLVYFFGEVLVPIGTGLYNLTNDFLELFGGNNDDLPQYVSYSQLLSLQDRKAARQLNYWSALSSSNSNHIQTRSFNQTWQQTLENVGWPTQSRNIAISNGNECGADNGFAPGAQLLDIDSTTNPGFLLDLLAGVLAPITGAVIQDVGLILVGAIPGRSRWETRFDFNSYGSQGSQNRIYRGRLCFKKKILWIGPTVTHDIFNKSEYAPQDALPFDTYSGGRFEFLDGEGNFTLDIPILENLVEVENEFYGFIPVVSALDIKKTNGNDPTPSDYLKSYSGGIPSDPNLESGFDAFIVDNLPNQPVNNEHISFQVRNGNWLAAELEADQPGNALPVLDDCSFICNDGSLSINGMSTLCNSASFTINAPSGSTVNWSVSNTNAVSISNVTNNSVTLAAVNGSRTNLTLTAVVSSNACGGSATVNKILRVGPPDPPSNILGPSTVATGALVSYRTAGSAGATSYDWRLPYPFNTVSTFSYFGQNWELALPGNTSSIRAFTGYSKRSGYVQVAGVNACGPGGGKFIYVQHGIGGGGGIPIKSPYDPIEGSSNDHHNSFFELNPNPASSEVNLSLKVLSDAKGEIPSYISSVSIYDPSSILKDHLVFKEMGNRVSFNIDNYFTGLYLLKIQTDIGEFYEKLLVK